MPVWASCAHLGGGLRGSISVALALSLRPTMPRELLVDITYVVVFSFSDRGRPRGR